MNYIVGVNLCLNTFPKMRLFKQIICLREFNFSLEKNSRASADRSGVPTSIGAYIALGVLVGWISFPALVSIWFICQKGIHLATWVWLAKVARVRARAQARGGAPSNPSAPNRLAWSCVRRPEPAQVLVPNQLGFMAATHGI